MGQMRAPKLVKDTAGIISSSTEKFIKKQNRSFEDEYETKVSIAFVTDFNTGRKSYDEYEEYYWDKLGLGENDALYIFVCRDETIDQKWKYGKKFSKLYTGEYSFRLLNDNFGSDVVEAFCGGSSGKAEIDGITGTFYHNLGTFFDEVTCPRDYEMYLASHEQSNSVAGTVENVVGGIFGLISRIISTVIGKIAAIGTIPTIILIIVIVSIIKGKKGGVSNRIG